MAFSYRIERQCAASPEVVYDLLVDVERWTQWLKGVRSATWEHRAAEGTVEGSVRKVVSPGLTMREEILASDRPHHHAYRILSGIPVRDYRADVHINDLGGGSLIVWQATFESRIPLIGRPIQLMLRASIAKMAADLVKGAERRGS